MLVPSDALGLLTGAVVLGAIHGLEPGHGWPVAASYALDRGNKWASGLAASLLIGVGHLLSSIAMVAVFFYAKSYFALSEVNAPVVFDLFSLNVEIGGPVNIVAGIVLVLLGLREYRTGHAHGHGSADSSGAHGQDHAEAPGHEQDHGHEHDHYHGQRSGGIVGRLRHLLPFVDGHSHRSDVEAARGGLLGIAWFAFLLGFAHEEEFEIIALCVGSSYCLELMVAYALTVIAGIVGLTLLLIAGYQHYEERVEQYTPYLPVVSAVVLVGMGVGFVAGVF